MSRFFQVDGKYIVLGDDAEYVKRQKRAKKVVEYTVPSVTDLDMDKEQLKHKLQDLERVKNDILKLQQKIGTHADAYDFQTFKLYKLWNATFDNECLIIKSSDHHTAFRYGCNNHFYSYPECIGLGDIEKCTIEHDRRKEQEKQAKEEKIQELEQQLQELREEED